MVGLLRPVRTVVVTAALAVFGTVACKQGEKAPVQDGAWQVAPDVAADLLGRPDRPGDVPQDDSDLASRKDASKVLTADSAAVGPRDLQRGEAVSFVPIDPIKVVFGDTFENGRTDNWKSADPGAGPHLGDEWSIVVTPSGAVYCQGSLDAISWHLSRPDTAPIGDQIVEAIVRVDDFYAREATYMAALFARYDPETDSGYALALRGDGRAIVRKRTKGTTASWDAGVDLGISPRTSYALHIEAIGSVVTAFVDGNLVGSFLDGAPLLSGVVALGAYGATMEIQRVAMAPP